MKSHKRDGTWSRGIILPRGARGFHQLHGARRRVRLLERDLHGLAPRGGNRGPGVGGEPWMDE